MDRKWKRRVKETSNFFPSEQKKKYQKGNINEYISNLKKKSNNTRIKALGTYMSFLKLKLK